MSDETPIPGLTGLLTRSVHEAGEQAIDGQKAVAQRLLGLEPSSLSAQLGVMSQMGTFKTRVQSGGRVTIPDAERAALGIEEGDIVQTIVVPVDDTRSNHE